MRQLALTGATVLTPFISIEKAVVLIDRGKIKAVGSDREMEVPDGFREISLEGLFIAPGLIDQHLHGGGGVEVMAGNAGSLADLCRYNATRGVTGFLATTMAGEAEQLQAVARAYRELAVAGYKGARCLGIHLEGPYLAPDFRGAHAEALLRLPSRAELESLQLLSDSGIKMITMAPELPGALEVAAASTKMDIRCSIGHSNADYQMAMKALGAGYSCVTHCFNQLRPLRHRDPGVLGAVLTKDEFFIEMIVDGIHLHPATVELIWRARGVAGLILISDAMAPAGLADGKYSTSTGELTLEGGRLTNSSGTMAGSVLSLDRAVKNVQRYTGCELTDAFRMATYNPALHLGLSDRKGSISPGKDADIIAVTPDLDVVMTMVDGEIISGLVALD
jgi:N-acetylglucosamine-6-phosphate deacetylase